MRSKSVLNGSDATSHQNLDAVKVKTINAVDMKEVDQHSENDLPITTATTITNRR